MRDEIIKEALSWKGTPYHDNARIKGVGADCLTFLVGVWENVGLIPKIEVPQYSRQWHLHRSKELYLEGMQGYCDETDELLPGNVILWKFGRCFSHGAIITGWPRIIHSLEGIGVLEDDAEKSPMLKFDNGNPRARKIFTFRGI